MPNLNFLNIKNLKHFINYIEQLHELRLNNCPQFKQEELNYYGLKPQPTKDFWKIIKLLKQEPKKRSSELTKRKVLSIVTRTFYPLRPFVFSSFRRTITLPLHGCKELFIGILFLQLLLVDYFTSSEEFVHLKKTTKFLNVLSIIGLRAYEDKYFNKPLRNINNTFLRAFLNHSKKTSPTYLNYLKHEWITREEKSWVNNTHPLLSGFKVYLGDSYFHKIFNNFKSNHISNLKKNQQQISTHLQLIQNKRKMSSAEY